MKKTFLLFLTTVTLLMGGGALSELKAQDDVVEIVAKTDDAISKSRYAPLNNNEDYSISQIYYTAEEIGRPDGGFIHNISFKTYDNGDGNYPYKREIEIYMVNTDEAVFSARTMKQLSTADRVFSGTVEFTAEEWVNITLTPFQYEGGNLLICVNDKFVDSYVSPVAYFYAFNSGTPMRCLNTYNHVDYQYKPTDLAITKSKGTSGSTLGNTGVLPYIRLTFGDGSGSGEGGDEPATPVAPATPANLTASATETTVVLSWDAVDGASYNVYQSENLLANVTETTYTVNNLTANTSYTFTVKAVKDQLESDAATVTVKTLPAPVAPDAPTNVVVTVNGQNSITVTWDAVDGAEYYIVYKDGQMFNSETGTSHTINNLTAGQEYCFAVQAYNANDLESELSETKCATTEAEQGNEGEDDGEDENGTFVIGDIDNGGTSEVLPIYTYYSKSISQQYYLEEEIGKGNGTISSIAFHTADGDFPCTRDILVYMINTDNDSFADKYMINLSESDEVFDGKIEFKSNQWITIDLDTDFSYTGSNILLCVYDYTGEYTDKTYFKTFSVQSDSRVRYKFGNASSNFSPVGQDISGNSSWSVPCLQFTFEAGEDTPEPIYINANTASITANGIDAITFTVTQGEEGTGDIVADADIYVNGEKIDGNTFTTIVAGNYTAYAMKDGVMSNEISFEATAPEMSIRLEADKLSLYSNGTDMVTFTVYEEGMGTVDVTTESEIYVNDNMITGNTFSTTAEGIYTVYAKKGELQSEPINITAQEWTVIGWVSNSDVKKIYPDAGYENTVNISNGHFTLWMTITGNNYDNGIILNNNYWVAGSGTNESYGPREDHRPSTPQPLSLPETIYVDNIGNVTITEIKDNVFYSYFEAPSQLGNELNNNISSLTIPSSITTIGNNAFNFNMSTGFVITSKVLVPPTIENYTFGSYAETDKGNYGKATLYVNANSVEAYTEAEYWERFYNIVADPSTMPTFIGNGEWTDASNWYSNAVPADGSMVRIAGEAYISTTVNTSNITVDGNASITIGNSGILYAEAAITNNGTIIMEDGGQLYYNATDDLIVTYKKVIAGYGEDDSVNDGWYTISSPVYSYNDGGYKYNEIDEITNLIPLNDDSRHYDLYRYYEEGDYDEYGNLCGWWENYKMGEDQMDYNNPEFTSFASGRGYLYASSQDVTLEFTGKVETNHTLYYCTTMNGEEQFCGFNLVGNPFTHNITADNFTGLEIGGGFFTVDNAGVWTTHLPNEEIKPAQGVLIKVFEEGDLDIKKEISRGRSNNGAIAITVTNGKYSDNAFVSFNAGKGLNKYPHLNKNAHKVYVTVEDTDYAIATMNDNVKEIPVSFEAMTMGQYTISVNTQDCKYNSMILIDKMSGIKTDLLNESYTFIATTDDDKDRFIVMLNADNDTDNSFIYINNNEMIIDNIDGQGVVYIYDIMGRPMAEYDVNGSARISTETFANGVYIVRMTDGNGVKTQKLTINN